MTCLAHPICREATIACQNRQSNTNFFYLFIMQLATNSRKVAYILILPSAPTPCLRQELVTCSQRASIYSLHRKTLKGHLNPHNCKPNSNGTVNLFLAIDKGSMVDENIGIEMKRSAIKTVPTHMNGDGHWTASTTHPIKNGPNQWCFFRL